MSVSAYVLIQTEVGKAAQVARQVAAIAGGPYRAPSPRAAPGGRVRRP